MDAFDADALIFAAAPAHPLGVRVRSLFTIDETDESEDEEASVGVGSVLLVAEVLIKPTRTGDESEIDVLAELLGRLDLRPVDRTITELSVVLGARYNLGTVDAVHLATAVGAGADRFITNNSRDFAKSIREIDIIYPSDL